jgi:hypothetical protein
MLAQHVVDLGPLQLDTAFKGHNPSTSEGSNFLDGVFKLVWMVLMLGAAGSTKQEPSVGVLVQLKGKVEWVLFLLASCQDCFRPTRHFLTLASSSFC